MSSVRPRRSEEAQAGVLGDKKSGGEGSRTPVREAVNDDIYTFSGWSGSFGVTRPIRGVAHPRHLLNLDRKPGDPVFDPAL